MGSVSSLTSSHALKSKSKRCLTSEVKLKKGLHKRAGRAPGPAPKALPHSQSGRSQDFFYIKVSHKQPRAGLNRGAPAPLEDHAGEGHADMDPDGRGPPRLLPVSGKLERSAEKALIRPTAFKPVIPKSASSFGADGSLDRVFLSPSERTAGDPQGHKRDTFSGTLSDSGRNSMSSLPTHSTSSLSACAPPLTPGMGPGMTHALLPNFPLWTNGNVISTGVRVCGLTNGAAAAKADKDPASPDQPPSSLLEETGGGVRSPITPDESLIERLEQRLLQREAELQELQVSFEEKEAGTCRLFEDRQRYCTEEMEGLKQRCSTKLRQASERVARTQQALQLQVGQLRTEKQRLQDELAQLAQEKDLAEVKLRSYQTEQLSPALEETQWEVCQKTGEISLLKQQLRDSQADVAHKLTEIVSLKALLKETRGNIQALEQQNKEYEEKIHLRTAEVEVCQNELQRKKNEADLLREKVGKLETDIQGMKHDLALAKEQRHQQTMKLEAQALARAQASEQLSQSGASGQDQEDGSNGTTQSLQREVGRLRGELRGERETQKGLANSFEQERQTWDREKDRVIKYQKQLQINYLQMHKKNQDLERILQELTAELDSRSDIDLDIHSSVLNYEDIIATEI